jgi:hypothetical protein
VIEQQTAGTAMWMRVTVEGLESNSKMTQVFAVITISRDEG